MHSLLEDYLAEVAALLQPLPVKRRNEELREMRAHLENALAAYREQGGTEEEAAQSTLAQFGASETIGQETVLAWRRGEMLDKRSLWGVAVCTLAVLFLVPLALILLAIAYPPLSHSAQVLTTQAMLNLCGQLVAPLLAGGMSGLLFSKRVMGGTALGAVLYSVLAQSIFLYWINRPGHFSFGHSVPWAAFDFAVQSLEHGLVALAGAWAGSQARLVWRGRLARG